MSIWLALFPAQAATFSFGAAPIWEVDIPFWSSPGLEVHLEAGPEPVFNLALTGAFYPDLSRDDYGQVTAQSSDGPVSYNDVSPMRGSASMRFVYSPFETRAGSISARTGLYGGFGVVWTLDDLEALQADYDDPVYAATASQLQPSLVYGMRGELLRGPVGLRLDLGTVSHTEVIGSTTLEIRRRTQLSLGVSVHPGLAKAR